MNRLCLMIYLVYLSLLWIEADFNRLFIVIYLLNMVISYVELREIFFGDVHPSDPTESSPPIRIHGSEPLKNARIFHSICWRLFRL